MHTEVCLNQQLANAVALANANPTKSHRSKLRTLLCVTSPYGGKEAYNALQQPGSNIFSFCFKDFMVPSNYPMSVEDIYHLLLRMLAVAAGLPEPAMTIRDVHVMRCALRVHLLVSAFRINNSLNLTKKLGTQFRRAHGAIPTIFGVPSKTRILRTVYTDKGVVGIVINSK